MDSTADDQDSEIRKLQELVKKLELQNQSLIQRHNLETDAASAAPDNPGAPADQPPIQMLRRLNGIKSTHDPTTTRQRNGDGSEGLKPDTSRLSLDCFGLIDVDKISLDADDSW